MLRFILASAFGGLYSMIILLDELPKYILIPSKLLSAIIIVLISFKLRSITHFIKLLVVFLFSSLICLGVVIAVCFLFKLKFVAVNNSVIYFDISAATIIVSAFVAYVLSSVILRLYNRSLSKNELYTLTVENMGESEDFIAFLDTGNRLREPFSNMPVILLKKSKANHLLGNSKTRFVPVSTVNNSSLLVAFKPEKIILKSSKNQEIITNAYVALCDDVGDKGFTAILNYDILSI